MVFKTKKEGNKLRNFVWIIFGIIFLGGFAVASTFISDIGITTPSINADDWTNATITESQIINLQHTTDTNRSDDDILSVASVYNDTDLILWTNVSGTATYNGDVNIIGFTMLGSDAPKIKYKKFTGTMVSGAGQTSFNSGINALRVLDISCRLTKTNVVMNFVGSTSTATAFNIQMNGASVFITPESSNYQNKPYECLMTYEE